MVEEKDATPEELELTEINAGLYAFDVAWLRRGCRTSSRRPSPASSTCRCSSSLPAPMAGPWSLLVDDDGTLQGINDRVQLAGAEIDMRLRINERHMLAGRHDPRSGPHPAWTPRSRSPRT